LIRQALLGDSRTAVAGAVRGGVVLVVAVGPGVVVVGVVAGGVGAVGVAPEDRLGLDEEGTDGLEHPVIRMVSVNPTNRSQVLLTSSR
jgi:hypothetical protein